MRGIIVKPKSCCGKSTGLGKVIEVGPHGGDGFRRFFCSDCDKRWIDHADNYYKNLETGLNVEKSRVKILPDDPGLIEEAEIEKELHA